MDVNGSELGHGQYRWRWRRSERLSTALAVLSEALGEKVRGNFTGTVGATARIQPSRDNGADHP